MKKFAYIGAGLMLPFLAAAQVDSLQDLGSFIIDLINNVGVPLIFAIAFIVFIWGIFQYFVAGGHDEEAKDKGKSLMLYGIVGIAIMASVWGLVAIVTGTVELDNAAPELPETPETNR